MLKRPAILCLSLLCAAVLVLGLVHLFELRLDRGDVYPPYSTLRTDPLGASVLFESLNDVPDVTAERYFEETFKKDDGKAQALFVLGTQSYSMHWMSRAEFDTLQRFVFNGGRVVITYYPEMNESWSARLARTNETDNLPPELKKRRHSHRPTDGDQTSTNSAAGPDTIENTNSVSSTNIASAAQHKSSRYARRHDNSGKPSEDPDQTDDDDELKAELRNYVDMRREWGFGFTYNNLDTNDDGGIQFPEAKLVASKPELPAKLAVHTSICFTNLTNGWATIYQRAAKMPVVIERKFGAGAVVLVADSYPLSNEAMFKDRQPALLAWLLGGGRHVIFDEAHLGIVEQPGMATLMRRYQLHGLILGLLLVASLFVWKNSASLVPPHALAESDAGPVVVGRDSASGFVNLMRRSIAPADLINVCFAEWKKSAVKIAAISPAQRRDLEQLVQQQAALEPQQRKPVENYRVICQILQRKK